MTELELYEKLMTISRKLGTIARDPLTLEWRGVHGASAVLDLELHAMRDYLGIDEEVSS